MTASLLRSTLVHSSASDVNFPIRWWSVCLFSFFFCDPLDLASENLCCSVSLKHAPQAADFKRTSSEQGSMTGKTTRDSGLQLSMSGVEYNQGVSVCCLYQISSSLQTIQSLPSKPSPAQLQPLCLFHQTSVLPHAPQLFTLSSSADLFYQDLIILQTQIAGDQQSSSHSCYISLLGVFNLGHMCSWWLVI